MNIVMVKCKNNLIKCETESETLKIGDFVIVEDDKFTRLGEITNIFTNLSNVDTQYKIVRIANKSEIEKNKKNIEEEKKVLKKVISITKELKLNMSVTDAFYTLNKDQLIITYVSDSRVDFRDLAKKLASLYKTRIELRQIGIRDKAKCICGIGQCGRKLCCSAFLNDLDSVSISMAKNQRLALNPNKINGVCGRLLCCLNYENDMYEQNKVGMPSVGEKINQDGNIGVVSFVDIPNRKYTYIDENNNKIEVKMKDEKRCDECKKCNK